MEVLRGHGQPYYLGQATQRHTTQCLKDDKKLLLELDILELGSEVGPLDEGGEPMLEGVQ